MHTFEIPDFARFQSPENRFLFSEPVRPLTTIHQHIFMKHYKGFMIQRLIATEKCFVCAKLQWLCPFHTTDGTSCGRSFTWWWNRPQVTPFPPSSSHYRQMATKWGNSFLTVNNSRVTVLQTLVTEKQPQLTFGSSLTNPW